MSKLGSVVYKKFDPDANLAEQMRLVKKLGDTYRGLIAAEESGKTSAASYVECMVAYRSDAIRLAALVTELYGHLCRGETLPKAWNLRDGIKRR